MWSHLYGQNHGTLRNCTGGPDVASQSGGQPRASSPLASHGPSLLQMKGSHQHSCPCINSPTINAHLKGTVSRDFKHYFWVYDFKCVFLHGDLWWFYNFCIAIFFYLQKKYKNNWHITDRRHSFTLRLSLTHSLTLTCHCQEAYDWNCHGESPGAIPELYVRIRNIFLCTTVADSL